MADTPLIHFRHGAGDRAPRSEHRLKSFDLIVVPGEKDIDRAIRQQNIEPERLRQCGYVKLDYLAQLRGRERPRLRSEEHTSELQSLMRISYAVFCLKKK